MADERETYLTIPLAIEKVKELLKAAFDELRNGDEQQTKKPPELFPKGIGAISITANVSNVVTVTFKVVGVGENPITGLLDSGEIGGGLTAKVAQEVTGKQ